MRGTVSKRRPGGTMTRRVTLAGLAALLSLVVAAGTGATPASSTTTWSATTAPLTGLNPPAGAATPTFVLDVACPSTTTTCVGVGAYTDASAHGQALIESGAGSTWTASTAPLPAGAAANPGAALGAVACPAAGSCVSVGAYNSTSATNEPMAEVLSAGSWTAAALPLPGNASATAPNTLLSALTCSSPTSCVAVGHYHDTTTATQPLIETLSGSTWTATQPTLPGDAAMVPAATLASVACPAVGSCVAAGEYANTAGNQGLVETLSGGTWTPSRAVLPTGATLSPGGLQSVACPASGSCVAVGTYTDAASHTQGLIETLSGGTWSSTPAPLPSGTAANPAVTLKAVACPASGNCVIAGADTDASTHVQGLIESLSAGTWTASVAVLPAMAATDPEVSLNALSCPVAGACVVAGTYSDGSLHTQGLFETLTQGAWTATAAPLPTGAATNPLTILNSTSCTVTGACVAGGVYTDASAHQQGLVENGTIPVPVTGYWEVGADGGVFSFGPTFYGSTGNLVLNQPVVAMASTADGMGYWFVARDGGIFAYGDAGYAGSVPALGIHVSNIVGMAVDSATGGYWLVGSDGSIFSFGAPFRGSVPGVGVKTTTIVGITATPDGGGYYVVEADGAVFSFGDATYRGGANTLAHLNAPIVGLAVDSATGGYWEAGSDGGVYSYGAPFHGSAGALTLAKPVVGMSALADGSGYYLVAADGGLFAYNATYLGSMGARAINAPMVGMAVAGSTAPG